MTVKNLNMLAVDLGASNGRVILGRFDGEKINLEVLHKFANGGEHVRGNDYWDILYLFSQIKQGLMKAEQKTDGNLTSLGIDTWGVDYGLLDKADNLLTNPYHYRDNRTEGLMTEVFNRISREEIYQQTGIEFMWFNTLYQLYADLKYRPWILENAHSLLFTPDLLNFFFTGIKYNEYTIASTSQLFNPQKKSWAKPIMKKLGLPIKIMQEIIYPGETIGEISDYIKKECGINGRLPLIAVGSHDTQSAVAAAPLEIRAQSVYLSSGTWSLLGMELEQPIINQKSLEGNFTNECGVGQKINLLKNLCGLWLIQECKKSWEKEGNRLSYDEIDEAAQQATANKFKIDPDDSRFKNPPDMVEAINEYCRQTDQQLPEDYGEMARGIYESLAASYNEVILDLENLRNQEIKTINIVGGGSKVEILSQFTANITGKKIVVGPIEATAIGNMLAQLMAAGEIASLKEGREIVRNSVDLKEYYPQN